MGNGWRSRGFGSLGMRSSGSTCTWSVVENTHAASSVVTNSHLPLSWTEIEIQTAFKPLMNEPRIPRNLPETGVPVLERGVDVADRGCG